MALKTKLDKATYDALPADVKKEYKAEGDSYILDVEDLDSLPGVVSMKEALARAKTNEVTEHGKTKKKLEEAEATIADLQSKDTTRTNDTKALEDKYKKALDELKKTHGEERTKLEAQLSGILVDAEALRIANEISTAPDLILPHIVKRLKADLTGEKPVTVVLDDKGEPSTKKIEELAKEFVANKNFAAIIKQSQGSGSGARQSGNGGGATDYKGKKFGDLTEAERNAFYKDDPQGFETASNAHRNSQRGYSPA